LSLHNTDTLATAKEGMTPDALDSVHSTPGA
jgi:hypothetical protein